MVGRLKTMLSKIVATTATALVAAASAVRGAFAADTDSNLPPEYTEMLRLAGEKVHAATQPGAIGNGVPIMTTDLAGMLPWIGIGAAVAISAVVAVKILVSKTNSQAVFAH